MEKSEIIRWLREYDGRPVKIMEVCGTHTSALYKTGLRQILSPKIQLLSGPGCPVCVTPTAYIDKLVEISFRSGHRVLAFGDMLAVPGTEMSLAEARDRGASVDFFYNPEEVLKKAEEEKETIFVLAAVGFETTAPVWATVVKEADERHISIICWFIRLPPFAAPIFAGQRSFYIPPAFLQESPTLSQRRQ